MVTLKSKSVEREEKKEWRLDVHLPNKKTLTYTILNFQVEGHLLFFTDQKRGTKKAFPIIYCELTEIKNPYKEGL